MRFYVVRHSETEFNKKGIVQGHCDSPLTEYGKKTAETLGCLLQDKNISKIYSSDLGRCLETSEKINEFLNVDIASFKELRERNCGELNGKPVDYVKTIIDKNDEYSQAPNGESLNQMKERVVCFIQKLSEKVMGTKFTTPPRSNSEESKLLIVTHHGCLTALLSYCYKTKMSSPECESKHEFLGEFEVNEKEMKLVKRYDK